MRSYVACVPEMEPRPCDTQATWTYQELGRERANAKIVVLGNRIWISKSTEFFGRIYSKMEMYAINIYYYGIPQTG
jgi:hypothetical protein